MNIFNEQEFTSLCNRYNSIPYIEEVVIRYKEREFFNQMKESIQSDRRGEVVFCVVRPNHKIITITCKEYPEGIFRIPTGGIGHNEDIVEAVYRETKEELGLETEIISFSGVIKIVFEHKDERVMFYSYLFFMKEVGGRLIEDATDDEVSEVKEVDLKGLEKITDSLNCIVGTWCDWGKFRYVSSNAVLQYLRKNHLLDSLK